MRAQEIFQNPLASQHGRRPVRVGRDQLKTSLSQQATAGVEVFIKLHTPEPSSINVWNSVMSRKAFVEECVIRGQEIQHAAAFA